MNCPIDVSILGHTLEVIATDGADIKPRKATNVVVSGGERYPSGVSKIVKSTYQSPNTGLKLKLFCYLN